MDILEHLAIALGLATLAGVNLYLTAFVTGLAIKFQWVTLAAEHEMLAVLGEWPVLLVAGSLLAVELVADKVSFVDSLWDSIHTVVRPVGGALMAVSALGATEPEIQVIAALLAGGVTLTSHSVKAGTRLAVNTSPEPVSNAVVSTAEDGLVLGGLFLMVAKPLVAGALCLLFLGLAIWLLPKMFRQLRDFSRRLLGTGTAPQLPAD